MTSKCLLAVTHFSVHYLVASSNSAFLHYKHQNMFCHSRVVFFLCGMVYPFIVLVSCILLLLGGSEYAVIILADLVGYCCHRRITYLE